jgi:hypothetical protein
VTTAAPYRSVYGQYGSLASYFGQSGGYGSAASGSGKAGGAGYRNDLATGANSTGDTQQASASSGSGWISAAASVDSTDKSNFSTPFQQGFGGIANNQTYVIDSSGADVSTTPGYSPITAPPTASAAPVLGGGGSNSTVTMVLIAVAVLVAAKFLLK